MTRPFTTQSDQEWHRVQAKWYEAFRDDQQEQACLRKQGQTEPASEFDPVAMMIELQKIEQLIYRQML